MLTLFAALFIKHFICDFPLQFAFQYKNKGTYGHVGGVLHSVIHGVGTLFAFSYCHIYNPGLYALIDMAVHYHIDWAKIRINSHFNLSPTNSEYFWWLLGLDQLLHYMTYVGLVWFSIG